MTELEQILRLHAKRYPQMEPTDAVKLIYQNEFGGGHLIRNEDVFFAYLRKEYAQTPKDASCPTQEDIGNSIIRVNLAALAEEDLVPLGKAFIRSASAIHGSLDSFLDKLKTLKQLTQEGVFSFALEQLSAYLVEYEKAGYPPVSHSQTYRDAYHPAYRIILRDFLP